MIPADQLEWGQTPFDDMTRDEMHLLLRRMFMALTASRGALHMLSYPPTLYWGEGGTGGDALRLANDVLSEVLGPEDCDEKTYRSYFRYAGRLLFPKLKQDTKWWINDDGIMLGSEEMPTQENYPHWVGGWRVFTEDDFGLAK